LRRESIVHECAPTDIANHYNPKNNYIMILLNFFNEIASSLMLPPEQRRASLATTLLARHCLFLSLRALRVHSGYTPRGNFVFGQD
jgi:hypothetical protein